MILNKSGLYEFNYKDAEIIINELNNEKWRVIHLNTMIASKDDFFDAIRNACPLDPPLHSNRSWEALADSLWSGLNEIDDNNIAIFWPNANCMKSKDLKSFNIATDILKDLCVSLINQNSMTQKIKKLLVLQTR